MIRWLGSLVLSRFLGGRLIMAYALISLARRLLGGRQAPPTPPTAARYRSVYQPSQGSSQIVQREPR